MSDLYFHLRSLVRSLLQPVQLPDQDLLRVQVLLRSDDHRSGVRADLRDEHRLGKPAAQPLALAYREAGKALMLTYDLSRYRDDGTRLQRRM